MEAKGKTGTVEFRDGAVTIHRKGSVGWRASTGAVEMRVPVSEVDAIQMKAATFLGHGAIRFVVAGPQDSKRALEDGTVIFTHRQNAAFETLAAAVAEAIGGHTHLVAC